MGKKITVTQLRIQLGSLLDQLSDGQSHFIIERNHQEVGVLLSMEKFRDIMQMLELFNTLELIDTDSIGDSHEPPREFPELQLLKPGSLSALEPDPERDPLADNSTPAAPRHRARPSIEDVAARLGIRVIK